MYVIHFHRCVTNSPIVTAPYIHIFMFCGKSSLRTIVFHGLLHECMSILPLTIIDRAKPQFHNRRKQVSGLWRALRYNLGLKCSYMLIVHVYLTPEMTTLKDFENMSRSQDSTMLDDHHLLPDSNHLLRGHGRKKTDNWRRRDHIHIRIYIRRKL